MIEWDDSAVQSFVVKMLEVQRRIQLPFLENVNNANHLKNALIGRLAAVSGGRYGNTLLAPNSLIQAFNVMIKIGDMVSYNAFQEIAALAYEPNESLDTIYVITDRQIETSAAP